MLRQFEPLNDIATSVAVCNETNSIVAGDLLGRVVVWNAGDGTSLGELSPNPPTLQDRLAAASANLELAQAALAPLSAKLKEIGDRRAALAQTIEAATVAQKEAERIFNEKSGRLATLKNELGAGQTERDQWMGELDQSTKALPLVRELHEKAVETASSLPSDDQLKQTAEVLAKKIVQVETRVSELNNLLAQFEQKKGQAENEMSHLASEIEQSQNVLTNANDGLSQLQAQMPTFDQQLVAQQAEVDKALQGVNEAQVVVQKWTDEMEFVRQLEQLTGELTRAREKVAIQVEELAEAQKQLDAATVNAQNQQTDLKSTENAVAEIEQRIRDLQVRQEIPARK
jgi:chromosome segregation ATPase